MVPHTVPDTNLRVCYLTVLNLIAHLTTELGMEMLIDTVLFPALLGQGSSTPSVSGKNNDSIETLQI